MPYTNFNWINDWLAIGGFVESSGDELPFDAVLSLETWAPPTIGELVRSSRVEYCWHSIMDGVCEEENHEIVQRFEEAAAQIDRWHKEGKRVLVHCMAGVSRSVTAAIWYLIRYEGFDWDGALAEIRRSRTVANPNVLFEIPLRLAAGECLSEDWLEMRVNEFCSNYAAQGWDCDVQEIWRALQQQGTPRPSLVEAGSR